MCFLWFRDEGVAWGVIEVGLGGLLDATNVIVPEAACITNINWDHMKQLGNTLESIALNKLGIVKPGIPLLTTEENPVLIPLFAEHCRQKEAPLHLVDASMAEEVSLGEKTSFTWKGVRYGLKLAGAHQVKNAVLAIETIRTLAEKEAIHVDARNIHDGLERTTWPGRFEIFDHRIVLDGAHNIGAIRTLEAAVRDVFPGKRVVCLFCMMKDKDHAAAIAELDGFVDEVHFTAIDYHRVASAAELYAESNHPDKHLDPDPAAAFALLRDSVRDGILLVCGSLYFVSFIRRILVP
jgi:dihydrofolate synthase/folylpolyglutamate synthase